MSDDMEYAERLSDSEIVELLQEKDDEIDRLQGLLQVDPGELERLKGIIKRMLQFKLDEYEMIMADLDGEIPLGLFTPGFWQMLKEAKEAVGK